MSSLKDVSDIQPLKNVYKVNKIIIKPIHVLMLGLFISPEFGGTGESVLESSPKSMRFIINITIV